MTRDPNDCTCPGAHRVDAKGNRLGDLGPTQDPEGDWTWKPNDPEARCAVHPEGYDPKTGSNVPRAKPREKQSA